MQGASALDFPGFPGAGRTCPAARPYRAMEPGGVPVSGAFGGRTGWRFGGQPVHHLVPALQVHGNEAGPHFRPQMDPGDPCLSCRPEHPAAALLNLVDQEGQHRKGGKHARQIRDSVPAMPISA